jgi:hypothetical protein
MAAERHARLERLALDLAFDMDRLSQLAPGAAREIAQLRAAASELQRDVLALAPGLDERDRVIRFAQIVLARIARDIGELGPRDVGHAHVGEPDETPGDVYAAAIAQWREAVRRSAPRTREAVSAAPAWRLAGTYVESCNCHVICPCRRVGCRVGRRPTYGVCEGALSWSNGEGHVGGMDLGGLAVVLACRYDDDEPGAPWDFALYLDDRADERQQAMLAAAFTGALGGPPLVKFPWVRKQARSVATRAVPISADHHAPRPWFRAGDHVSVRVGEPVPSPEPVSSAIPGHEFPGRERYGDQLRVHDGPLTFEHSDGCGYESAFDYVAGASSDLGP